MSFKRLAFLLLITTGLVLVAFTDGWRPRASRLASASEPTSAALTVNKDGQRVLARAERAATFEVKRSA